MTQIKRISIIGDENADRNYLHKLLGGTETLEDLSALNVQIYHFIPGKISIQSDIHPRFRDLKSYCELYFHLIQKPDLIIYMCDAESPQIEIREWLNIISLIDNDMRICFFSEARSYIQRQQIFTKISPLFYRDITQHIYFPNIDSSSVSTCFCNIGEVGIFLMHYDRKIPTLSKIKNFWRKWIKQKDTNDQII